MWKMDPNELLLTRGGVGGNTNGNTGEGFIDRSKVRILLCDNDTKSSEEVFHLLCKCSYQVTSARSPRQVIDALNAEGPDIDIILSEVDLPMAKGFKMLKYIMRDKDLQRIPIIMMSAQDEVALVVKCLRLGAADYLVKPLRTNELLNLWTHMWRRRRMLGLAEKNIMNCEFDLVQSDPSDANTNSTTLFSDDTDEKSKKTSNPEISVSFPREDETNVITTPTQLVNRPNVPEINEQQRGKIMFGPKKSELKIGQSSAFFTYVKTSMSLGRSPTPPFLPETSDPVKIPDLPEPEPQIQQPGNNNNNNNNNNYHPDVSGYNAYSPYPYYHYNHAMQCPPGMGSFPYYPVNYCLPGAVNQWPPASSAVHKIDRREAALIKFRQKRKERCFDKKIRYVNRKKLAERRPRVRGQFVRKINGINVDLNGQPSCTDFDDEDDDVEDEDDQDQDPAGSDDNYPVFHG